MPQDPTIYPTSYWPSGDVYPLLPLWIEYHTPQSLTANANDEQNVWLDIVYAQGADWSTTLLFTDIGLLTLPTQTSDDTIPAGFVAMSSRIWRTGYGFNKELKFTMAQVRDPNTHLWTGAITVANSPALNVALGYNAVWNYNVSVWLQDPVTMRRYAVCGLLGTIVQRRAAVSGEVYRSTAVTT